MKQKKIKSLNRLRRYPKAYNMDKLFWLSRKSRVESSALRSPILLLKLKKRKEKENINKFPE